ncbi:MAG: hypothetical protein CVV29_09130, partial [Methanobacteriales archaeon HGW-Methanobacteriales-2]
IAYVSSDDVWESDKLEKQVKTLDENQDIGVVLTKAKIIDENGEELKDKNHFYYSIFDQENRSSYGWLKYFFLQGNCLCHPSAMFRRTIYDDIGLYNERLANLPDLEMWVRVCLKHNIHIIDEKLIKFRIRDNNANASTSANPKNRIRAKFEYKQILDHYLTIKGHKDFLNIFPEAQDYGFVNSELIPYFLGRLAYDTNFEFKQLWGLEKIFDFMKSDEMVNLLEKEYNYKYSDFLEMSAEADVFKTNELLKKETLIKENIDLLKEKDQLDERGEINSVSTTNIKEFQSQINNVISNVNEIGYQNNNYRSILKRLISNFPALYILFKKNNGFKNTFTNVRGYYSIKKNNLLDIGYYLNNRDVKLSGIDPILHYIYYGYNEGRRPNLDFDAEHYLKTYSDVKKSKLNPLVHYSLYGMKEKRKTFKISEKALTNDLNRKAYLKKQNLSKEYETIASSGMFDSEWYLKKYGDFFEIKDPLQHYIEIGCRKGCNPGPLFDTNWYLNNNSDVAKSGFNPLLHFVLYGVSELRDPIPLFDASWYKEQFVPDLSPSSNPLLHYISKGSLMGYDPHPLFSTTDYIQENPEVIEEGINPLLHYIEYGRFEGNTPSNLFNPNNLIKNKIPGNQKIINGSPILGEVPPAIYLRSYLRTKKLHNQYGDMESFLKHAIINPTLINKELSENDIRIISMMDNMKRDLSSKYSKRSHDELVSVIMPTHNRANLIGDAILSVLAQKYPKWELIVIDDAGEDNTEDVVLSFRDDRIQYHKISSRKGNAIARNYGLSLAKGSVIAYLDDDDMWDPDALLIMVHSMRDGGKKTAYSAQMIWEGFNSKIRLGNRFKAVRFAPFNRSLLENANYISMISFVHDARLVGELGCFDESLQRFVDYDLILRYTENEVPSTVPCILSHYFEGRDTSGVSKSIDYHENLKKVRKNMVDRTTWVESFSLNNEEHTLFGTSTITKDSHSSRIFNITIKPVQIIIPNYEAIEELEACVESIANNTNNPYEIIITDNNSSEKTRKKLDKLCSKFANVQWIPVDKDTGFSFAVNAGFEKVFSKKQDIVILNNDTIVTPNWLEELQLILHENSNVSMVVPRQVLLAGNSIAQFHSPATLKTFEVDVSLSAHHKNIINPQFDKEDGLVELSYAPFFCVLICYDAAIKTGLLDSRNGPHFRSDWIYCDALRRKTGKKIVYTPHSKVYHIQGVSTNKKKNELLQI